ncbi:MAG: hypothetical protein ACHQ6T_03710 [Myxococcota bacterium]
MAAVTRVAAVAAALLAVACAAPIRTELHETDLPQKIEKLAVVGLRAEPSLGFEIPRDALAVVTARIVSALGSETQLRVVEPSDSDAILTGAIRRYSERDGSASGVRHPASVWFALELRDSKGRVVWTGTYEETQTALSDDMGSLPRAWERGFRWVTAADLADYGARMLVRELAREVATWS